MRRGAQPGGSPRTFILRPISSIWRRIRCSDDRSLAATPIINQRGDYFSQFGQLPWLGEKSVRAKAISFFDVGLQSGAAEHDYRDSRQALLLPKPLQNFETIHPRHLQIQHHDVWNWMPRSILELAFTPQIVNHLLAVVGGLKIHFHSVF